MPDRCHINAVLQARKTNYHLTGNGHCVVFLHGYMEDHRIWLPVTGIINGYSVLLPDLPGSGKELMPENTDAIEFMADVVHELVLHLGFKRYSVVGNSMGGYVAFRLIKKHGGFIDKTILLSTNPFPDTGKDRKRRLREIALLRSGRKDLIFKFFINSLEDRFKELYKDMAEKIPSANLISLQTGMMNRPDNTDVFLDPSMPVYYMSGDDDKLIPLNRIKELLERSPKVISAKEEQATHFLVVEKPEVAGKFILDSLEQNLHINS